MQLDYKTNHANNASFNTKTNPKTLFFKKQTAENTHIQCAVRIQPNDRYRSRPGKTGRRLASVAAFFVFAALIATVNNRNINIDGKLSPMAMMDANAANHRSSADPDFYFIDSNQFVTGSAHETIALYRPEPNPEAGIIDKNLSSFAPGQAVENKSVETVEPANPPQFEEEVVKVKSGDTISEIFVDHGVATSDLHSITSNSFVKKHLTTLRVGQEMTIRRNISDKSFASVTAKLSQEQKVVISKGDKGFTGTIIDMPLTRLPQAAAAKIESSLFLAGQAAGLSQKTIMNLVDIFQWDVDFSLDIRKGDGFKVIYEKLYREGEYVGEGDILAAEFNSGDRNIRAIRYTDFSGRTNYFTPQGRSMRKAFLRNPVDVVRITSHFNPNRKHPVLHTLRAHKGTDYGAPIGTPIRSSGDGKIIYSGVKGSYGKTVIIKHGDKYTTLYAHMSKIAKASRSGKRIQQGQIIGYVGKTGRVTGAHLHYEFRINGVHKNPLKVKLPGARPLSKKYKADFLSKSRQLTATLDSIRSTSVAMSQ